MDLEQPLKVMRVVTRMNIGGPSLHVAVLSAGLNPARFSTTLLVGQPDPQEGNRLDQVRQGPVRVHVIPALRRPFHPVRDLQAFAVILRILWKEEPDILHTHMAKAGALARMAGLLYNRLGPGRRKKLALVHTFHGHVLKGYFPQLLSRLFTALEQLLARRTDRLIAVSDRIRDELLDLGIGRAPQWQVIRLGVDFTRLKRVPVPNGTTVFRCGLVGRLVPIKNPGLFLSALERIAAGPTHGQIQGHIIGDGPLRAQLQKQADRQGLLKQVSFLGWRNDPERYYGDLDAVCVTSRNEGTPLSLIEAMAAGRAVISTAVGGVLDLLGTDSVDPIVPGTFQVAARGLLVRENDSAGLAAAMTALATDPALRNRLAKAGRQHVLEAYSHTRLLQDISELYEQLADG